MKRISKEKEQKILELYLDKEYPYKKVMKETGIGHGTFFRVLKRNPRRVLESDKRYIIIKEKKRCLFCHKEFLPDKQHPYMKFCKERCSENARYSERYKTDKEFRLRILKKNKKYQRRKGKFAHYKANVNYKKKNRALYAYFASKRRELKKKFKHDYTKKEWLEKVKKTEGICPRCNKIIGIKNMTLDHIQPISKAPEGFVYTIDEVQPLCAKCNSSKGDKIN